MAVSRDTQILNELLEGYDPDEPGTQNALFAFVSARLESLIHRKLMGEDLIRRWYDTGDVSQNVRMRIWNALKASRPANKREFLALSATMIRRELVDLARHLKRKKEDRRLHHTTTNSGDGEKQQSSHEKTVLFEGESAVMREEIYSLLNDREQEVWNNVIYNGMTDADIGLVMGLSSKTIQRCRRDMMFKVDQYLNGPESKGGER